MNGYISKIQKYSTKDGPGLRSTVFLVGCNLDCVWCANPELKTPGEKYLYYPERCAKCGRCVRFAANNSIILTEGGCVIDRNACTNLRECAAACYFDAYEVIGYEISSHDLCAKLLRDKDFYDQSGGGVTFSGGEAALQADFIAETAKLLRKESVHVALDTAGLIPVGKMKKLIQQVDLVLYDIKAMDRAMHKACTSVNNQLILDNAQEIAKSKVKMIIRLIIVPGYNDDKKDFAKRLEFIKELGDAVTQVDILGYHKLGESKYTRMGIKSATADISEPSEDFINEYVTMAIDMGFKATKGG